MRRIEDIKSRVFRTFLQAFCGVLIPELVAILNGTITLEGNWLMAVVVPIFCASLAAGISAVWGVVQNYLAGKIEEDEHDFTNTDN